MNLSRVENAWVLGEKIRSREQRQLIKGMIKVGASKNARAGKNTQSETQRLLTLAHGYYFTKNFEQFYHIRLT